MTTCKVITFHKRSKRCMLYDACVADTMSVGSDGDEFEVYGPTSMIETDQGEVEMDRATLETDRLYQVVNTTSQKIQQVQKSSD